MKLKDLRKIKKMCDTRPSCDGCMFDKGGILAINRCSARNLKKNAPATAPYHWMLKAPKKKKRPAGLYIKKWKSIKKILNKKTNLLMLHFSSRMRRFCGNKISGVKDSRGNYIHADWYWHPEWIEKV